MWMARRDGAICFSAIQHKGRGKVQALFTPKNHHIHAIHVRVKSVRL